MLFFGVETIIATIKFIVIRRISPEIHRMKLISYCSNIRLQKRRYFNFLRRSMLFNRLLQLWLIYSKERTRSQCNNLLSRSSPACRHVHVIWLLPVMQSRLQSARTIPRPDNFSKTEIVTGKF